eukprot:GHVU01099747.1.p1 GENE.GHVU01099747.1~~GHVU01099747.1.p1  ORF type:complete len:239 (-),score=36.13 GHVU01099747.1:661-1377(-)
MHGCACLKVPARWSCVYQVSFFDCDDIMHPQRNEILYGMFKRHPELHIATHFVRSIYDEVPTSPPYNYSLFPRYTEDVASAGDCERFPCAEYYRNNTRKKAGEPLSIYDVPWPYEALYNHPVVVNTEHEPNTEYEAAWFFPQAICDVGEGVHLDLEFDAVANGHPTIKAPAVSDIQFSNLTEGEDALFLWRALKKKKNVAIIPLQLTHYLRNVTMMKERDKARSESQAQMRAQQRMQE